MSNELENLENHDILDIMPDKLQTHICNIAKKKHIIYIDDVTIKNELELNEILKKFYSLELFNSNSKIHMKLKMNLNEYLIISNMLYPTFVKLKEKIIVK